MLTSVQEAPPQSGIRVFRPARETWKLRVVMMSVFFLPAIVLAWPAYRVPFSVLGLAAVLAAGWAVFGLNVLIAQFIHERRSVLIDETQRAICLEGLWTFRSVLPWCTQVFRIPFDDVHELWSEYLGHAGFATHLIFRRGDGLKELQIREGFHGSLYEALRRELDLPRDERHTAQGRR